MTRDLLIRLIGDGQGFALTMLELADDGFIIRGYRKEFAYPFRARDLDTLTPGYRQWSLLTPDEKEELIRIRGRVKSSPPMESKDEP